MLLDAYVPFANMIAAQIFSQRSQLALEFNDFFQLACIGLLEAIERFDPTRGVRFETFSSARIRGAVLNGLETMNEVQQQLGARRRVISQRTQMLSTQVAPPKTLLEIGEVASFLALGLILEGTGLLQTSEDDSDFQDGYSSLSGKQLRSSLLELVDKLPNSERKVIRGHYLQGMKFEEIAEIENLTKGRISQIHHAALRRLREGISV